MTFKRAIYASTLAAGVGLAGLFGVGLGTASANPDHSATRRTGPLWTDQHDNQWRGGRSRTCSRPPRLGHRGIDQAATTTSRSTGTASRSIRCSTGATTAWGFWFLGQWIPL